MLKRHRQSSPPPPSSSNVHLSTDLGVEALEQRYAKRRRMYQFLPDGAVKGIAHVMDDDDSYEDYRDDDTTNPATHALTEMTTTTTSEEYKSANTILRELHILNQHRLMFTPPTAHSFSIPLPLNPTHRLLPMEDSALPTKLHPTPMQGDKLLVPYSSRSKFAEERQFEAGRLEEAGVVSENYENINKLLGSVFLSRRRILDSCPHNTPHL